MWPMGHFFVLQKQKSASLSQVKPLMPSILRLMSQHEDERVVEECESIFVRIGEQASEVLDSGGLESLIDHYIKRPDVYIIGKKL